MLDSVTMLESSQTMDPYIPYGRGGAGNMRRQSAIRASWRIAIARQQNASQSTDEDDLSSSASSTAADSSSRRASSSNWSFSSSSDGVKRRHSWKRFFSRRAAIEEEEDARVERVKSVPSEEEEAEIEDEGVAPGVLGRREEDGAAEDEILPLPRIEESVPLRQ